LGEGVHLPPPIFQPRAPRHNAAATTPHPARLLPGGRGEDRVSATGITAEKTSEAHAALGGLAAFLMGCAITSAIFGWHILSPWHTGWMLSGRIGPDPVQYWLGYTFFARSPWSWPPGLNPDYGLEIASSIYYADAIPLLAFAFKALHPILEVPQYWGLWLYACGGLQAWLAWRLLGLATDHPLPRLLGAALLVLQPMLLGRLGGHFALGGQFLQLAALLLYLTPVAGARRIAAWCALLVAASLIHAYLLPMTAGFWAADWLARATNPTRRAALIAEALLAPALTLLALWAAGAFMLHGGFGGSWGGFGRMQLDLLAPFDAEEWGGLLANLPDPGHLEVGNSYLGLGSLLLLLAGAIAWTRRPRPFLRRHWPLLLMLAFTLALAITHRVAIGGREYTLFTLPEPIQRYADALRASERFFWPVAYTLLVAAALALIRGFGPRRASLVLAAALAIQVVDLRPGLARLRDFFVPMPATLPLRLSDPFWAEAARRYDRIRIVPAANQAPWWEEVAVFAATAGLATDAVYLARLAPQPVAALNARMAEILATGRFEPRTLYVLADDGAIALARASADPARDLIGSFNHLTVLAPGWRLWERE